MADRTNKAAGIKVISQVGQDPEAGRFKRVQEEEMKLRASLKTDSKVTFNSKKQSIIKLGYDFLTNNVIG